MQIKCLYPSEQKEVEPWLKEFNGKITRIWNENGKVIYKNYEEKIL